MSIKDNTTNAKQKAKKKSANKSRSASQSDLSALPVEPGTEEIALRDISASKLNRSYHEVDEDALSSLRDSIEAYGLIHPLLLLACADGRYQTIAGEHRRKALIQVRGADGVLKPEEYKVVRDVEENDPRILRMSMEENSERTGASPYQLGSCLKHLKEDKGLTDQDIAAMCAMRREAVGRLIDLVAHWDELPPCWQADLRKERHASTEPDIRITRSHWAKVSGYINENGVDAAIWSLMEEAHTNKWSIDRLRKEVGTLGKQPDATSMPAKPKSRTRSAKASRNAEEATPQAPAVPGKGTAPEGKMSNTPKIAGARTKSTSKPSGRIARKNRDAESARAKILHELESLKERASGNEETKDLAAHISEVIQRATHSHPLEGKEAA